LQQIFIVSYKYIKVKTMYYDYPLVQKKYKI